MNQTELNEVLEKHKLWLNGEEEGEMADLWGANLRRANLREADLNYSVLPLWCGSLHAKYDDRQVIQFLYHTLSAAQSEHVSEEVKKVLLSPEVVEIANRFHLVEECGEIKSYEEEN